MFGILIDLSTLLVSICGIFLILVMVVPNLTKLKRKYWFIIKSLLAISLIIMIVLFSIKGEDLFFYFGFIFGISFILQVQLNQSENKNLFLSFSLISFSFIFLSFNQKIMFFASLVFSYIFFLAIGVFTIFQEKPIKEKKVTKFTLDFFINLGILCLMIIPIIFICSIIFSSADFFNIWIEGDSLITVFEKNYAILIFSIISLIFLVFISIYIIFEIISNNRKRAEEPWYT